MAKKYFGADKYPRRSTGEKRVLIKIEATHVIPPHTPTHTNTTLEIQERKNHATDRDKLIATGLCRH